jgi:hypothetical protein
MNFIMATRDQTATTLDMGGVSPDMMSTKKKEQAGNVGGHLSRNTANTMMRKTA